MRQSGWVAFVLWGVVGALFAFALISAASVGLLVLPIAALAAVLAARYVPHGRELLGLLAGAAAISILIGFLSLDYYTGSCPESPNRFRDPSGAVVAVESCGGFNPVPWFVAGGVLPIASVAGYGFGRAR